MSIAKESDLMLFSQNPGGWGEAMHGTRDDRALQKMLDNGYSVSELNYLPGEPPAIYEEIPVVIEIPKRTPRRRVKIAA